MKIKITYLLVLLLWLANSNKAIANQKDSLLAVTRSNKNDSLKSTAYYLLCYLSEPKEKDAAIDYFNKGLHLADKLNNEFLKGQANKHLGHFFIEKLNDYSNGLKYFNIAVEHFLLTKNYERLVDSYNYMARRIYEPLELIDEEKNALKKCVQYAKMTPSGVSAGQYYVLGWFETNIGESDSAIVHLGESYRVSMLESKGKHTGFSTELMTWIGNAYGAKKEHRKALSYQLRCAKICDSIKNEWGYYESIRYAANSYNALKLNDSAIFYLKQVTDYFIKNKVKDRIYFIGSQLIRLYVKNKDLVNAEKYVKVLSDTTEFNYKTNDDFRKTMDISLFHFYKNKNDYKTAVNYLLDFQILKDSTDARKARANLGEQTLKYEFQKQQESQKLAQQQKDFEAQDKLKKQRIFNYAMIAVILVIGIMLFMAYKIIKQKQIAFKEISAQKEEIERQKTLVETKNKEISDSINYAKRLQEAILPDNTYLQSHFNDSFIFYQPKDIVAGDFYFFEKNDDQLIIAAGDCTGHGVPGALVSVVCSNALTRSIKEFGNTEPGKILDKTRELVIETFEKSNTDVKDGMDISLISIKTKKGNNSENDSIEISWSGANNPLWYIQNNEFKEIKPHKQSIGKMENYSDFPTHTIQLHKGDVLYLITDGFADQFGGPKGKKFKYKQLQDLLNTSAQNSLSDQLDVIKQNFFDWKRNLEQVDDVCVIGLRL